MADLKASAETFANDLINQNIAGLMMAFTPNGMGQAMALQGQMASQPQPQGKPSVTVNLNGQEGEDHLVDLVMSAEGSDQTTTIVTRWKDVAGAWKVDAIALKA
ncbi:MAG TPA: hypothetical protein PKI89_12000 [Tepidiformaceae bacterium]|nr:hypothetical protein [Tepidiformaceae bacterium]